VNIFFFFNIFLFYNIFLLFFYASGFVFFNFAFNVLLLLI